MLFLCYWFLPGLHWVLYKNKARKEKQGWLSGYTICHVSLGKILKLSKSRFFTCNMRIIILALTSSGDCYEDKWNNKYSMYFANCKKLDNYMNCDITILFYKIVICKSEVKKFIKAILCFSVKTMKHFGVVTD